MDHKRVTIRTAVKAALVAGVALATPRVFVAQDLTLLDDELPAITIWTPSDKTEPDSVESAPRELKQDMVLEVIGWVGAGDDDDEATANALDALCAQIETAMHADPSFAVATVKSCGDSFLNGTVLDIASSGEQMMGRAVLEYTVRYQTDAPVAPTLPDDFDTGHTEFEVSDDANDAQDTFTTS